LYYATKEAIDLINEIETETDNSIKLLEDDSKYFEQFHRILQFFVIIARVIKSRFNYLKLSGTNF
jgi:hypothetical protein